MHRGFLCLCVLLGIIQDGINHLGIRFTSLCGVFQIDIGPGTGNAWCKRVALNAPFWMFKVLVRFKVEVNVRIGGLQIWPVASFLYGKCTVGDVGQTLEKVGFLRFGSGKLNSKFIVAQIDGLAFACLAESLGPAFRAGSISGQLNSLQTLSMKAVYFFGNYIQYSLNRESSEI